MVALRMAENGVQQQRRLDIDAQAGDGHGPTRKEDLPPPRFRREPVLSGPYRGFTADESEYNRMLDEFYALSGWDLDTGNPSPERLEDMGFPDVAEKLRTTSSEPAA